MRNSVLLCNVAYKYNQYLLSLYCYNLSGPKVMCQRFELIARPLII